MAASLYRIPGPERNISSSASRQQLSNLCVADAIVIPSTAKEDKMSRSAKIQSFKDLIVWQKALQLCLDIYRATQSFPSEERFGLTSELRKTSRSVTYNIAEGHQRRTTTEYLRFLDIASGSRGELETQLLLAQALGYLSDESSNGLLSSCEEVAKILAALARALRSKVGRTNP
jgi:four helix bundle protein